ncbi:hypothetical protein C7451_101388 [Blastomonas natatoria]|uniref:Anti-sigma factor NepR domain-containing protein n=1 Tax=Blastomonas natatoria TaxID=34015 RepID=A0A2V3VC33_9SPHN|nr:NepR family anti-sigma factor [Blastomonas natatoria]PXW79323.1 hypothetical protein C7451_101388 [Blastomonas natatoria]
MLVHRNNDDQSGGDKPAKGTPETKPHLVDDSMAAGDAEEAGASVGDDGKSHLIGDALKSVYQRTLEEEIPDDFLDLLKQLK